ncbi:lactosylceramide 1,3-N-acetyl-beta-D-glucosaminyltransferase-like [Mercenaria mercenaria]|uniref:lactosylceramide 1,3-N-acetyl-beta-D-glucosaminyltransferase-like n=1 Tax=Mercenaria mercenaria TaxID=6596 RepID=UPI00234EF45D|nr:lactosylceramide 1,3-N-acetyl-beta-D-glucosaminyltransferase-like [Mercenaria mercenaria]
MGRRIQRQRLILFTLCIFVFMTQNYFIYKIKRRFRVRAIPRNLMTYNQESPSAVLNTLNATYQVISNAVAGTLKATYHVNSGVILDTFNASYRINSSEFSVKTNSQENSSVISNKLIKPLRVNWGVISNNVDALYRVNSSVVLDINSTYRVNSSATSTNLKAPYRVKIKPGLSKLINSSVPKYPYIRQNIYENGMFCSSVTNLTLLILVLSATTNFKKRQTLRQTWANESLYTSYGTLKVLFLLGITENATVQKNIDKEFKIYGDMVQGSFIDSYHNLTHKSTMGFKWATERCRNAKYVLKTDDDIVIDIFKLFKNTILNESENKFDIYCIRQSTQIFRRTNNKWFVENYQFKGLYKYPTYCGGSFVMILNEVVPFIHASISRTPFFWIEDVLLYGIVLNNIPELTYKTIKPKDVELYNFRAALNCLSKRKTQCPLFIFMTSTDYQIMKLWATILQIHNK